jgi:hypothetical protein
MRENKQKNVLHILLTCFFLSTIFIIVTTPLHEAAHWVMSDIDPYSNPVELHLFDDQSLQKGQHILSSTLGYVVVKETYPGSFKDRPNWIDPIQEIICVSIQILLTCFIISKTFVFLSNNQQNKKM